MEKLTDADARTVNDLEASLTVVLMRADALNVDASIAVIALCRCARKLLDGYPENQRRTLAEVCARFLEHKGESGIILTH
jgi:hypothetical protein